MAPTEDQTPSNRITVPPVLIILMGVSGTGKSTLGSALAKALDFPFIDGDDLHPQTNIEKMAAGHPLTDADREPWLQLIRKTAEHKTVELAHENDGAKRNKRVGVVIACSALKRVYRDLLRGHKTEAADEKVVPKHLEPPEPEILPTYFVFIDGSREVLMDRMTKRTGHFMKVDMLDSQLKTLENPTGEEGVVLVPVTESTEEQVNRSRRELEELFRRTA